jgi:hypothetical protein
MEEEKRQREEEREKEIMEQKHFISKQKEENHDFSQKICTYYTYTLTFSYFH